MSTPTPTATAPTAGPEPTKSAVSVSSLEKIYEKGKERVAALRGIDLEVADGEMLILLGPSGCGKSTILRCLAGLEEPTTGVIKLGGEVVFDDSTKLNLPPDKRDIGLVFQTYVL